MPITFQMWQPPEKGRLEDLLLFELQIFFDQSLLPTRLEYKKRILSDIKQHYAELNTEHRVLAENGIKIDILEKCIAENETTRQLLLSIVHLATMAKETSQAMRKPWTRTIQLNDERIDIFSADFVDTRIKPFLSELEIIAPVGFSEFPLLPQDKGIQNIQDYTIEQRDKAIQKSEETKQWCNQFLQHYASLKKEFNPKTYFQLRKNLSVLIHALQPILEATYSLVVPLFHKNKQYANRILPEFKAKMKAGKIEEKLKLNCERLEKYSKEIIIHETSIQHLEMLIRGEALPSYLVFFPAPKPALNDKSISDDNVQTVLPDPKTWTRRKLGMGG